MTTREGEQPCTQSEDFLRLPGLFRRWEIEQVIQNSDEFHISAAGSTEDGADLFAVYYRERLPGPQIDGGSR